MAVVGRKRSDRPIVAFSLAALGVVAAVAFAASPVEQTTLVYEFRPLDAIGDPVVAPLAIARSTPDAIEVTLPCDVPGSQFRSMTLGQWSGIEGTVRSPVEYQDLGIALQVGVGDGYAFMALGGTEVARLAVEHTAGCEVLTSQDDGSWTFQVGSEVLRFEAGEPRFAEALFDGPAATSPVSSVTVMTRELGSSPSRLQVVFLIGSIILLGMAALSLADHRQERQERTRHRWLGRVAPVDVAVGVSVVVWILLIPAGFDDGWVVARQSAYDAHGAFSNLFDLDAAVLPLAHWVEWLQRFWLGATSNSLWGRLPVVLLAGLTWMGLRWLLDQVVSVRSRLSEWVMALAFMVGFGAWDITLRPEPILAGLLVASLACSVLFTIGRRGPVLVAWIAVIALAVTAHPAGVITLAPVAASIGPIRRWVTGDRRARWMAVTLLLVFIGLTTLLFFVDSNVTTRLESVASLQAGGHDKSIGDEPLRYEFLGEAPYGAGMRRASVGLIVVGAGLFALGIGSGAAPLSRLPGRSLVIALGLLALTPSKWSWHFGGLVGLAALALAVELARIRRNPDPAIVSLARVRSLLAGLGVIVVAAWSWRVAASWTALDLRTMEWWAGASNFSPVSLASPAVWLGIFAVVLVVLQVSRKSIVLLPEVMVLVATGLVITVTAVTLAADTVRTDGWTFGRQNMESLWNGAGCGLGDEVMLPVPGSLQPLLTSDESSPDADESARNAGFSADGGFFAGGYPAIDPNGIYPNGFNAILPVAGMAQVGSWDSSSGTAATGGYVSPWHDLGDVQSVGVMMMGAVWDWDPDGNAIAIQWGQADDGSVSGMGLEFPHVSDYFVDWTFLAFEPPFGANRVRVLMRDARSDDDWGWLAGSMPLGFDTSTLADVAPETDILVSPPLGLYFPCVSVPAFDGVVVPAPGVVVNLWRVMWETTYAAAAASDRYFRIDVILDPTVRTPQIGAHLGDPASFVFVSQEFLTGTPARANGSFELVQR